MMKRFKSKPRALVCIGTAYKVDWLINEGLFIDVEIAGLICRFDVHRDTWALLKDGDIVPLMVCVVNKKVKEIYMRTVNGRRYLCKEYVEV